MPEFIATIDKIDINPVIDPPDDILEFIFIEAGRRKGPMPVRGMINGAPYRQTLVRFRGKWRLYINGEMCRAAAVGVGDTVRIDLEYDPEVRRLAEPARLTAALEAHPAARTSFDALTPSRRKEIIRYLSSLSTDEAVETNIAKVLRNLTGRA